MLPMVTVLGTVIPIMIILSDILSVALPLPPPPPKIPLTTVYNVSYQLKSPITDPPCAIAPSLPPEHPTPAIRICFFV
jgi:hypothetical protein